MRAQFITAEEVQQILGVSRSKAYQIIQAMNRANEVRSVMAQLGRIAEKHKCAMILVGHLNKSQGAKNQYRGLGSIDFQAAARSVLWWSAE